MRPVLLPALPERPQLPPLYKLDSLGVFHQALKNPAGFGSDHLVFEGPAFGSGLGEPGREHHCRPRSAAEDCHQQR